MGGASSCASSSNSHTGLDVVLSGSAEVGSLARGSVHAGADVGDRVLCRADDPATSPG
jgi:hypothetical protein